MRLLIIRHAIAMDREEFARSGQSDDLRPLTAEGRARMERGALGLRALLPALDVLATSPLIRARETAAIVSDAYGGPPIAVVDALVPDAKPAALVPWLRDRRPAELVAVVGHQPHLEELASWLLTGRTDRFMLIKKGGACLLEFGGKPDAGAATLLWSLMPRQLRAMAP